jgi:hypothetical protein
MYPYSHASIRDPSKHLPCSVNKRLTDLCLLLPVLLHAGVAVHPAVLGRCAMTISNAHIPCLLLLSLLVTL